MRNGVARNDRETPSLHHLGGGRAAPPRETFFSAKEDQIKFQSRRELSIRSGRVRRALLYFQYKGRCVSENYYRLTPSSSSSTRGEPTRGTYSCVDSRKLQPIKKQIPYSVEPRRYKHYSACTTTNPFFPTHNRVPSPPGIRFSSIPKRVINNADIYIYIYVCISKRLEAARQDSSLDEFP